MRAGIGLSLSHYVFHWLVAFAAILRSVSGGV